VGDVLGLDPNLILEYLSLIFWPALIFLILPVVMLVLIYASALFLTVYKWRSRLHEAYHKDFWDGARHTLAVLWEAQATIWHGTKSKLCCLVVIPTADLYSNLRIS